MGRSKDIATSAKGDADYVNASGDTMSGDLTIDTNTFHVDVADNRVGVGTASPDRIFTIRNGGPVVEIDPAGVSSNPIYFNYNRSTSAYLTPEYWALGHKFMRNGGSAALVIDGSGNVLFGTADNPDASNFGHAYLHDTSGTGFHKSSVNGTGNLSHFVFNNTNGYVGQIYTGGSTTSYITSSDYRMKENVVGLDNGITRVKQLSPKRFNFIADANKTVDGFLAHEAQTVVPEAINGTKDEVDDDGNAVMQGIDQSKLVPLLTAALQEAIAKIETLETKVAALEAE